MLYCNAPYIPAPLIAGNSRPEAAVLAADGVVTMEVDAPTAGTMPKTSFGLGGKAVDSLSRSPLLLTINASCPRRSMMYLKNSYVDQQMAVAGIEYNTLGSIPLKKPVSPAVSLI